MSDIYETFNKEELIKELRSNDMILEKIDDSRIKIREENDKLKEENEKLLNLSVNAIQLISFFKDNSSKLDEVVNCIDVIEEYDKILSVEIKKRLS